MSGVVKGMDKILSSMDMDKIAAVMDKFEQSFDQLDLQSQMVEGAINSSTASTMPEDEVDMLIAQVSDEHGLDFASKAADASRAPVQVDAARAEADLEDTLEARLAALRG